MKTEDQQERHSAPWSACAAEGVNSEPQGKRDQAQGIREHRTAGARPYESSRGAASGTRRSSWVARWTSNASTSNWWDDAKSSWDFWQDPFHWATPHSSPPRGFNPNYLTWRKAVLRWKSHRAPSGEIGKQGYELSGF